MVSLEQPFEVVTIGRIGVDLYPLQVGRHLADVEIFGKFLGGSAANVAVACARYGRRTAIISKTGQDPFGEFLRRKLEELGVSNKFLIADPIRLTPVTFCEIFPPDNFPLYFYRVDPPDLHIERADLPPEVIGSAGIYWSTLTGLSQEPSRDSHFDAWEVRGRRPYTIIDLDYRKKFWDGDEASASKQGQLALAKCTVAVGNIEECRVAVGETDPYKAAKALLDAGVELAVIKLGPNGALAMTTDDCFQVPGVTIQEWNGLGAGDAFGGALCHGLLADWPLSRTLEFASAAGALVASRLECSTAMPDAAQVEALLNKANAQK